MDGHGVTTDNYGLIAKRHSITFRVFEPSISEDRRSLHITHSDQRLARLGLPALG